VIQDLNTAWTTYTYDAKNRLTQDLTSGANAHSYTYTYDGNDNRLSSSETGSVSAWTYDVANRMVTSINGSATTSFTYDRNGCQSVVNEGAGVIYTMLYDNMLRLNCQISGANRYSYTYDAGNLKRYEDGPTGRTTIIWDGTDYLGVIS
jgi:YD repeat-containing protein